jgi:glycosyltransferase involved in cell wall biosynthesis
MLPLAIEFDAQHNLLFESQAANGLERWADNFDHLTVTCVRTPAFRQRSGTWTWRPVRDLACADRLQVVPMPWACRPRLFLRHYSPIRRWLRQQIAVARYLCFSLSYSWGDWAALGAFEAIRQGRPYSVWTDMVDHQVVRFNARHKPLLRRLYGTHIDARLVRSYHHYLIRHSRLGLFHGRDCYDAYAPICTNPHLVHNIHLRRSDAITPAQLHQKARELLSGSRLRIGYVGRVVDTKGPDDWLEVLRQLIAADCDLEATWLGDGPMHEAMRHRVQQLRLADRIHFPGFITDRGQLLDFLKGCHLCLFCHKVPESPRCLIEALVCGCPIIGYDSPYPRDLIAGNAAGVLTPRHDVTALAAALATLQADRQQLAELVRRTAHAAESFNDEAVFRHRSELIKQYL